MSDGKTANIEQEPTTAEPAAGYRVLARKYRPASFDDLIGQDAMVRTISNSFEAGRIPQAWILTGVRGVGKTTTARILARALNYELPDGSVTGPTINMPVPGIHDQAIMESRHFDVIEMDAASHNRVDDIRQINDELLRAHNARRTKISQVVLWARGVAITLVPALGIALGWWTATRLERSAARIQVTLHDPLLAAPDHLGTVHVRGGIRLWDCQRQYRPVGSRDWRVVRRREGNRGRARERFGQLAGLHAAPDQHHQLRVRFATRPGCPFRRRPIRQAFPRQSWRATRVGTCWSRL